MLKLKDEVSFEELECYWFKKEYSECLECDFWDYEKDGDYIAIFTNDRTLEIHITKTESKVADLLCELIEDGLVERAKNNGKK